MAQRLVRQYASVALCAASMLHGCAFGASDGELDRLEQRAQVLDRRVTRLEQRYGVEAQLQADVPSSESLAAGNDAAPSEARTHYSFEGAASKLLRGGVNLISGWVEVPKRVQETTERSGAWTGFTWGLLRGLGYGFIRTAGGAYEMVTFPFPAPLEYRPIIQPTFVFLADR